MALIRLSDSISLEASEVPATQPNKPVSLGTFLISPSPAGQGEFSVLSSGEFNSLGSGFLGIEPKRFRSAFIIERVSAGHPAEKAGLKAGDRLIRLNDKDVDGPETVFETLDKTKPGDTAKIVVVRDASELKFDVELGRRPMVEGPSMQGGHIAELFEGGKSKATEFERVLLHDARVKADQCGGPVFDLHGTFIGINAARKSRSQSYILPTIVVADFVAKHRNQE